MQTSKQLTMMIKTIKPITNAISNSDETIWTKIAEQEEDEAEIKSGRISNTIENTAEQNELHLAQKK